jgi:beta-glucosidase
VKYYSAIVAMSLAVSGCVTTSADPAEDMAISGSEADNSAATTKASADQISQLLAAMSLERKVAQLIMPDIAAFTPEDMERYRFGSYLNGGNSGPGGDDMAPAAEWLILADEMWAASTAPMPGGEPVIPTMWATDAVHGHANVIGATVFPHNVGLGATRDADLIRRIGAVTATEVEVTGIDWTFAPTIAVARDDRWGRTYESYSEDPELVATLGAAMVEGLQGKRGTADYLGTGHVIASAKHFFGDGGTDKGVDQGEVTGDIDELKAIHVTPYPAAIAAGVETVMASFNSINGRKMHGNADLLDGVLRAELGFQGLVVGDWNGHGQVKGCTVSNCPQSLMAGLDIYMVPEDWKALLESLVAQVNDGTIPMARIDEAAGRVLRLKQVAGILDSDVRPSARPNGGDWGKLGSAPHRAVAREAVAKSLILLKNESILPLKAGANILVAGTAADNIPQQAGGWSITWQGGGELTNQDFPGATSIFEGLAAAAKNSGGTATLSVDGEYGERPDVAIVVFGEVPYAEFAGDRKDLAFRDEEGLELLRRYQADGIPAVAVLLSGRPLWVNREINAADAFVAAWLPGSEGAGVADVLYGAVPATGKLSLTWPATCEGAPINGPAGALFPLGYRRALEDNSASPILSETCSAFDVEEAAGWFESGRLAKGVMALGGEIELPNLRGNADGISARGIDRNMQEDAREVTFEPGAVLTFNQPNAGDQAFRIVYQLADRPTQSVHLLIGDSEMDITQELSIAAGKGWREMVLTDACLAGKGDQLVIRSDGPLTLQLSTIVQQEMGEGTDCSF